MIPAKKTHRPGGRRDQLNPYRVGARLMLDRLRWDLSPIAWKQRHKLNSLHNSYAGEKAVILCNGPGLLDIDFGILSQVFTFGLNKINLLFNQTQFRPSALVAVNSLVIEQNKDFFSSTSIPLFIDSKARNQGVKLRENVVFIHSSDFPFFSRDCSLSVFEGFTVTYVALQLAFHMGFSQVALVGCDHDYHKTGKPNEIAYNNNQDVSHFCKNYFATGQPWEFPDLLASELYYDLARRCYNDADRVLVNASTRTQLDILPLQLLENFINNG